jgi:hypothetical protein
MDDDKQPMLNERRRADRQTDDLIKGRARVARAIHHQYGER